MNYFYLINKITGRLLAMIALLSLVVVVACDDDEKAPDPVTVKFSSTNVSITEDGGPQTITLALDKAAFRDGSVKIDVSPASASEFLTVPASVSIASGSTSAQFTVTPINNVNIDGSHEVTLTLTQPETGFVLGTPVALTVNVLDDEGPVVAAFEAAAGSVLENAVEEGIEVSILLSDAADVDGSVVISISPASAAITTVPAKTDGTETINIPVAVGDESVSFIVKPINNTENVANPGIVFTIMDASGGVEVGTTGLSYNLTITDDDDLVAKTIPEIRAMYAGAPQVIADNISVSGVVISSSANVTAKNVWINDGNAGILLRFNASHTFVVGDRITVKVQGGTLQEFNGTLQIGNNDLPNDKAEKTGTGTVDPQTITLEQLLTGNFEGKLVKIENVSFPGANGINTVRSAVDGAGSEGNNKFTDGARTAVWRVESYAPFKEHVLPFGSGAVIGIASEFTNQTSSTIQITPRSVADIFESVATSSLEVSETTLATFGDITHGEFSTAKSFTVAGTQLTEDVIVTAPSSFVVALEEAGTYEETVTITKAAANAAPVTVYVKFNPTSGINQGIDGSVTITSTGADAKTVSVSGNEIGNTNPWLFEEAFNYTAGDLLTGHDWEVSSGAGTNPLTVVSPGLEYDGYPSTGNALAVGASGEDLFKSFAAQTSTVYLSFVINVSAAQATGDYFIALSPSATQTNYYARLHIKSSGSGYVLGIKKSNETNAAYGTTELSLNTQYVIVVKYTVNAGDANDAINVYALSAAIPATEPTAEIANYTEANKADAVDLGIVTIRQGNSSNAPTFKMDGIRVASDWTSLFAN